MKALLQVKFQMNQSMVQIYFWHFLKYGTGNEGMMTQTLQEGGNQI